MKEHEIKIFAGTSSFKLANKIADKLGTKLGDRAVSYTHLTLPTN